MEGIESQRRGDGKGIESERRGDGKRIVSSDWMKGKFGEDGCRSNDSLLPFKESQSTSRAFVNLVGEDWL